MKSSSRSKQIGSFCIRTLKTQPVIIVLIVLIVIFSVLFPGRFLSFLNLKTIMRQFVTLMLFALGPSMVVVIGSLDLSYVGIWMLGGVLVWLCMPILGLYSIFVIYYTNFQPKSQEKFSREEAQKTQNSEHRTQNKSSHEPQVTSHR